MSTGNPDATSMKQPASSECIALNSLKHQKTGIDHELEKELPWLETTDRIADPLAGNDSGPRDTDSNCEIRMLCSLRKRTSADCKEHRLGKQPG